MQNLMTWEMLALWLILGIVVPGASAYCGAYLRKRGEDRATNENLRRLVSQMEAVTAATKQIEAKISDEVWNRQRRWELKRDLLIETIRALAGAFEGLRRLAAAATADRLSKGKGGGGAPSEMARDSSNCGAALDRFDQGSLIIGLVCGPELEGALKEFRSVATQIAGALTGGNADALTQRFEEVSVTFRGAAAAIRKELEAGA